MTGPASLSATPTSSRVPSRAGADEHREIVVQVSDTDRVAEGVAHVVIGDAVLAGARRDVWHTQPSYLAASRPASYLAAGHDAVSSASLAGKPAAASSAAVIGGPGSHHGCAVSPSPASTESSGSPHSVQMAALSISSAVGAHPHTPSWPAAPWQKAAHGGVHCALHTLGGR